MQRGYRCLDDLTTGIGVGVSTTPGGPVCLPCFFPHHCLENNTCLIGTTGPDCQLCNYSQGGSNYGMVASSCVACNQIPTAAVSLAVFLIIIPICIGLARSLSPAFTKLKILVNFVQLVYLGLFVKVPWSPLIGQMTSALSFSTFTSDVAMLECYMSNVRLIHYLRWITAIAVPSLIFCLAVCVDRTLKKQMRAAKHEYVRVKLERRRSAVRYFLFLVVMSYYMPVGISAVQSFSCSTTFGMTSSVAPLMQKSLFLYDPTVSCDDFLYQTFNFVLTMFVLLYIVLTPLSLIFFTLRQRKWALLECKSAIFGCIYDSYTKRFCFWESLAMMRKITSIGVTSTVLTDPLRQSIVLLSVSGFYLLILLAARPFRPCAWRALPINVHMLLEVVCTVSLCLIHTGGLLLALDKYPPQIDFLLIGGVLLALLFWIIALLTSKLEKLYLEVSFEMETKASAPVAAHARIKRNKVGEYVTSTEVEERVHQVEF